MKTKSLIAVFGLLLVVGLAYANGGLLSQQPDESASTDPLSQGGPLIGARPSKVPQQFVDVYSVTSEVKEPKIGPVITKVRVKNRSSKSVAAIKLGWRVTRVNEPHDTLLKGDTPLLGLSMRVNESRIVEYPIVAFAKIQEALSKKGLSEGNFDIEVTVTDVLFEDGSQAVHEDQNNTLPIRLVSSRRPDILGDSTSFSTGRGDACQNQVCKWNTNCYQCQSVGGDGFGCTTSQCNSCTETRCGDPM